MNPRKLPDGKNEFGRTNVPNEALTLDMVPGRGATWPEICEFELSFDAYSVWGGETGDLANRILERFNRGQGLPADLTLLRTALFFEQRRYHHFGWAPENKDSAYIDALLAAIRSALVTSPDAQPGRRAHEVTEMDRFVKGEQYTRSEIHEVLGGGLQTYLPTENGRVVCGAFRTDTNPDAPNVILPGFGPNIQKSAELFAAQSECVPVFLKRSINAWEYVGSYRVTRLSRDPQDIAERAAAAGRRAGVSMVLYLGECEG